MKKLYVSLTVLLALLIMASVAVADSGTAGAPRTTSLSGAEEVGGGDADGSGFAAITLNAGQGRVCWSLTVADIAAATAAHIHDAPAGVNGPVVVPLSAPSSGSSSGCTTADPTLIQDIIDHPEEYYVNVHNADFPGGALRGQLSNPGQSD